jgi:hypothetical protein
LEADAAARFSANGQRSVGSEAKRRASQSGGEGLAFSQRKPQLRRQRF